MNKNLKCKKIAFVTHMYFPSNLTGSIITIDNLAKAFRDKGYDVSIIVSKALDKRYYYIPFYFKSSSKKYEIINGIKVYRLNCNQVVSLSTYILRHLKLILPKSLFNKVNFISRGPYLVGLYDLLKKSEFDVIFTSPLPYYLTNQVGNAIEKLDKKPLFIFKPEYHFMLPYYNNPEFQRVFDVADIINIWTNSEKKSLQNLFSIDNKKIKIIRNALVPPIIKNKNTEKIVKKYSLRNRKIILYAGVKSKYKGAYFLLDTINDLYKKDKSYLLIAIGQKTFFWNLKKIFINPKCYMDLGYVSIEEKESFFELSHIYCMPSISEALGLSYLEAWYKKKPVIASRFPVMEEVIGSSNGGLMVEFGNLQKLEDSIQRLFKDKKLANRLGRNGYKALNKYYMFNEGVNKYLKLFNGELNN
jgi:glycosyltransferase involved in cell wall biosynthesis